MNTNSRCPGCDTAATLTEAERASLDVCPCGHKVRMHSGPHGGGCLTYVADDGGPYAPCLCTLIEQDARVAAIERIVAARLAAQPPQEDLQPDEREALGRLLFLTYDSTISEETWDEVWPRMADAVQAAGFHRGPDAGKAWDQGWRAALGWARASGQIEDMPRNPYLRAALAKPTPGAKSDPLGIVERDA